jgi:ankyrin repeat protein
MVTQATMDKNTVIKFLAAALCGDVDDLSAMLVTGFEPNSVDVGVFGGRSALHCAAMMGRANVARILLGAGATVDARDSCGRTPLHEAAGGGHLELVHMLLDAGADINARASSPAKVPASTGPLPPLSDVAVSE